MVQAGVERGGGGGVGGGAGGPIRSKLVDGQTIVSRADAAVAPELLQAGFTSQLHTSSSKE